MGAVAEGSPSIRAQANLSALGLHEMAASLPDYVRMVAAGERGFASALEEMTRQLDAELLAGRQHAERLHP